jgi:hypothetical protein
MLSATSRGRLPGATSRAEPSGNFKVIIAGKTPKVSGDAHPYKRTRSTTRHK